MLNFVYDNKTEIVFGKGTENEVGNYTKLYGKKVLLHYGRNSIKKYGLYDKVISSLKENNIDFVEDTKKNVLFLMLSFLKDYVYYSYNTVYNDISMFHINDANKLLASLGSVLSVANYNSIKDDIKSLFINVYINKGTEKKYYSYYVSNIDADNAAFKNVYDFYYKYYGKKMFESELAQKFEVKDVKTEKLILSKQKVMKAMTKETKPGKELDKSIDAKLKSLRKGNFY